MTSQSMSTSKSNQNIKHYRYSITNLLLFGFLNVSAVKSLCDVHGRRVLLFETGNRFLFSMIVKVEVQNFECAQRSSSRVGLQSYLDF